MDCSDSKTDVPLPDSWSEVAKKAFISILGMAHMILVYSRSWCANSRNARVRLQGELDRADQEVSLLLEELRIKNSRLERVPAKNRPHYPPVERMAILELKAVHGWNTAETAKRFMVEPATISSWGTRIDEDGSGALVQTRVPVNKYPDFIGELVRLLKRLCPRLGKVKIAQVLGSPGDHIEIELSFLDEDRLLPVVSLRHAA